jgi:glycosyltransferase involved in cell wall biosynthesis
LAQTFTDWELIVVDDGSTDGTADIVRQFTDPRIRLVPYGESRGLPVRLNQVVRLAAGELFARMDGDDIMYPERLRLQHDFLQEHPEVDLLGGATMVFRGDGVPLGTRGGSLTHEEICANPWRGFLIPHPTWIGRTAWFRENPYPEEMLKAQDQALLLRSFAHSRFASLGDIVLGYYEGRPDLDTIIRRRYYATRAFWRHGEGAEFRMLATAKQVVAGLVDLFAVVSGLEYSVLRQRATPASPEQLVVWRQVWADTANFCHHSADAPCSHRPVSGQAPAVHRSKPLVSIAMPAWNCERTIAMAIASVLNQQYDNWELLVMDDGSADSTLEIADSTGDARVRVFSDGHHRALPARLNQAVSLARGCYLARTDADDVMYPERLACQVAYLTEHPEVDLVAAALLVFRKDGEILGSRCGRPSHEEICARPWAGFPLAHPTWLGRTAFFRTFAYRDDVGKVEDQELLFRARHAARFACLPELLLGYREDHLRLGRMLGGRLQYAKMLVGAAAAHSTPALAARGVLAQAMRGAVDVLACATRLDYTLLRQRARPVTADQVERWHAVWDETQRTATSFGVPKSGYSRPRIVVPQVPQA